jgi:hypothetical protein
MGSVVVEGCGFGWYHLVRFRRSDGIIRQGRQQEENNDDPQNNTSNADSENA